MPAKAVLLVGEMHDCVESPSMRAARAMYGFGAGVKLSGDTSGKKQVAAQPLQHLFFPSPTRISLP